VCCSVLHCVAVCCSVLQCVALCCSVLQCVAVCCSVLQCERDGCTREMSECVAVRCSVSQCVSMCCSVLPCVAVCCRVLHCVTVCCSMLQCVALWKNWICSRDEWVCDNASAPLSLNEFSRIVQQSTISFLLSQLTQYHSSARAPLPADATQAHCASGVPKQSQGYSSAATASITARARRHDGHRNKFPTVALLCLAIGSGFEVDIFPRGVKGVESGCNTLSFNLSVSTSVWNGVQSQRDWWRKLLIHTAGLEE